MSLSRNSVSLVRDNQAPLNPSYSGIVLVMVLWWQLMSCSNCDFVTARVTTVDTGPWRWRTWFVQLVKCLVFAVFEKISVFVEGHSGSPRRSRLGEMENDTHLTLANNRFCKPVPKTGITGIYKSYGCK